MRRRIITIILYEPRVTLLDCHPNSGLACRMHLLRRCRSPSPVQRKQTHEGTLGGELKAITIVSTPTGARIVINGVCIREDALLIVDFAVNKFGRAVRNMEVRAVAPIPLVNEEIKRFLRQYDGDASRIPRFLDFDLNIHPVFVIR